MYKYLVATKYLSITRTHIWLYKYSVAHQIPHILRSQTNDLGGTVARADCGTTACSNICLTRRAYIRHLPVHGAYAAVMTVGGLLFPVQKQLTMRDL